MIGHSMLLLLPLQLAAASSLFILWTLKVYQPVAAPRGPWIGHVLDPLGPFKDERCIPYNEAGDLEPIHPECRIHPDGTDECCQCMFFKQYRQLYIDMVELYLHWYTDKVAPPPERQARNGYKFRGWEPPKPPVVNELQYRAPFEADELVKDPNDPAQSRFSFRCYVDIPRSEYEAYIAITKYFRTRDQRVYYSTTGSDEAMVSRWYSIRCRGDERMMILRRPSRRKDPSGRPVLAFTRAGRCVKFDEIEQWERQEAIEAIKRKREREQEMAEHSSRTPNGKRLLYQPELQVVTSTGSTSCIDIPSETSSRTLLNSAPHIQYAASVLESALDPSVALNLAAGLEMPYSGDGFVTDPSSLYGSLDSPEVNLELSLGQKPTISQFHLSLQIPNHPAHANRHVPRERIVLNDGPSDFFYFLDPRPSISNSRAESSKARDTRSDPSNPFPDPNPGALLGGPLGVLRTCATINADSRHGTFTIAQKGD